MNKPFIVNEFDCIICNDEYKDDNKYRYLDKKQFEKLEKFIYEFSSNSETSDVLDFMRIGYKRNVGDVITVKNYVGIIQLEDGFQIEVLPKIDFACDNTKKILLRMLHSMKDFPSKTFNNANLKVDKMNLYEIFIYMYLQEVNKIVKQGIKSSYIQKERNLTYYKGKLNVAQHIRKNLVHQEKFYVIYDEFNANIPENRIIKLTLEKLQKVTLSAENLKQIKQLLNMFDIVKGSKNYQKDFSSIVIDRSTKNYEILMKWSKVFLMNKSFTTFYGNTKSIALLFPMERLYESYVARQMKNIFKSWDISIQEKEHHLFVSPKKQFALKPDIVLRKGERVIVLDTKWKRLVNNQKSNYGISQSDMYQMYAYSKKYNTPEVWLLYPLNEQMLNMNQIKFDSGDGTVINVFFVDVANIENSLNDLKNKFDG